MQSNLPCFGTVSFDGLSYYHCAISNFVDVNTKQKVTVFKIPLDPANDADAIANIVGIEIELH